MYTSDELEGFPKQFDRIFSALENDVMLDIIYRIQKNDEITRTADWQISRLVQLGETMEEIEEKIKEALKLSNIALDNLYSELLKEGYARDEELYKATGKKFIPYEENEQLQQLIRAVKKQTNDEFINITNTMGFAVKQPSGKVQYKSTKDYLHKVFDEAMMHSLNGTYSYDAIVKKVSDQMTKSGVRSIDYASGVSTKVYVAARRAVVTGLNQVTSKITEDNMDRLDTKFVETSWHSTARPSHQLWQGRVFYWDKNNPSEEMVVDGVLYKSFILVTGYGTVTGLCGANCYHSYYPIIPGISVRSYTDEEVDRMNAEENKKKTYNGKEYTKYEATQYQRKLERLMRKQRQDIKLLKESGKSDDDDEVIYARSRYRKTSSKYTDFCSKMGLREDRGRIYVDGLKDIGKGKYKVSTESEHSARRNKDDNFVVKWNRVRTPNYKAKFLQLTDSSKTANLLYTRAKWALSNRDGLETEELYAINLTKGEDVASITNQQIPSGVKRTNLFNSKLNLADASGDRILLIHNHPRGLPPSIFDINALLNNKNVSGITIGHDGSIYHYTRPTREIPYSDFKVAMKHYKEYTEVTGMEKSLELLSKEYGFKVTKL